MGYTELCDLWNVHLSSVHPLIHVEMSSCMLPPHRDIDCCMMLILFCLTWHPDLDSNNQSTLPWDDKWLDIMRWYNPIDSFLAASLIAYPICTAGREWTGVQSKQYLETGVFPDAMRLFNDTVICLRWIMPAVFDFCYQIIAMISAPCFCPECIGKSAIYNRCKINQNDVQCL